MNCKTRYKKFSSVVMFAFDSLFRACISFLSLSSPFHLFCAIFPCLHTFLLILHILVASAAVAGRKRRFVGKRI